ncbi:monovalent cation:H+ antiporter, CPA1 (nhx1) [Tulasnella sp. 330]|nr:monovalent cation:H+ antiporter, CPA1 (nhx1) [Tulasnella sp. 330]KAG8879325.1 monovalent cation:H+ antiporter, CPA1 (nhx1) [Tulasnella sp. 331]KAG8879904.1 monovalent cation:H+ antiporter, CPA1 (nhx1) [Tulasnella sp. 332]
MGFQLTQAAPSPTPDVPETTPQIEELYSAWALTILCALLILSLWTSYYVQIKRIRAIHETVLAVFFGMFVGLIIRLSPGHLIREMLTFKHTVFFNLLLPPIILNSGYELKQENFFRNFGSILTFAFAGTFISAVGIGVLTYVYSFLSLESLNVTLLECLIFGSTLSATDPVTILAIFNQYKVDPKLYSVIFGESLLNDAVSIVMYETLSQFHGSDIYVSSIFHGIGIFLFSFCSSMALGVSFGLGCSLILKHSSLHQYHGIESCLVALVAYTSYFFSTALHMSGIVSLLFCGITLKHYAYHTMSRRTQRTTKYMFAVLAQLSENFIFIYLGLNLFTQDVQVFKPLFILVTTVIVCATRYAAVFPLSELINFFHRTARGQRYEELPHSYQMMLFWAGLRGAVGVALAAGFIGENAAALRTTVLVVVVLSLIMFGGTTARMLEVLGIRMGVEDGGDGDSSDDGGVTTAVAGTLPGSGADWSVLSPGRRDRRWDRGVRLGSPAINGRGGRQNMGRHASLNNHTYGGGPSGSLSDESDSGEVLPPAPGMQGRSAAGEIGADGKWFTALDERYLLPLFSNSVASRKFHARRARRAASAAHTRDGSPDIGFDTDDERGSLMDDTSSPRPRPRSAVGGSDAAGDFGASMTDFFRSIRGQGSGGLGLSAANDGNTSGGVGNSPLIPPSVPPSSEFRTPGSNRDGARDHQTPL